MQKTSKKRVGLSPLEERMKAWVAAGEARGIHFEYWSRSAGGAVGVVIFADGEDVINFNTYALSEAPRTLKKYYALSHGVLEGGAKERAIKACLDEMDAPDFADNHLIFAKKGAALIDYMLQMRGCLPVASSARRLAIV